MVTFSFSNAWLSLINIALDFCTSPFTLWMSVVFPTPTGPVSATKWPRRICSTKFSSR